MIFTLVSGTEVCYLIDLCETEQILGSVGSCAAIGSEAQDQHLKEKRNANEFFNKFS